MDAKEYHHQSTSKTNNYSINENKTTVYNSSRGSSNTVIMNDDEDYPPLEDADIEDVSSDASVVTDSSESISVDSDTMEAAAMARHAGGEVVIHKFNKLMEEGIEEGEEEEEETSEEEDSNEMIGDYKRRRGSLDANDDSFVQELGDPIIVPLKTGSDDEGPDPGSPRKPHGRRLSARDREQALERNMIRRQSSNEMLQAMQQATQELAQERRSASAATNSEDGPRRKPPPRTKSGDGFQRRPPPRTKSGEGMKENGGIGDFQRRPPPRTKSGEGMSDDSASSFQRRPPPRTKSGEGITDNAPLPVSRLRRARESRKALEEAAAAAVADEDGDAVIMSPSGRRRRGVEKEMALKRNAARRQKSSDMLGAMRDATRMAPARSQSTTAAFERRPPPRTKTGEGMRGGDSGGFSGLAGLTPPLRNSDHVRRPPARTKSGEGMNVGPQSKSLHEPRRRPPARTKSGSVFKPSMEDADEDSS